MQRRYAKKRCRKFPLSMFLPRTSLPLPFLSSFFPTAVWTNKSSTNAKTEILPSKYKQMRKIRPCSQMNRATRLEKHQILKKNRELRILAIPSFPHQHFLFHHPLCCQHQENRYPLPHAHPGSGSGIRYPMDPSAPLSSNRDHPIYLHPG